MKEELSVKCTFCCCSLIISSTSASCCPDTASRGSIESGLSRIAVEASMKESNEAVAVSSSFLHFGKHAACCTRKSLHESYRCLHLVPTAASKHAQQPAVMARLHPWKEGTASEGKPLRMSSIKASSTVPVLCQYRTRSTALAALPPRGQLNALPRFAHQEGSWTDHREGQRTRADTRTFLLAL